MALVIAGPAVASNTAAVSVLPVPPPALSMEPRGLPANSHMGRGQRVEEILDRRQRFPVSATDRDFATLNGCGPVEGSLLALPLADYLHYLASRGVCFPGQWLDSLFAPADADFYESRTRLRVINSVQVRRNQPTYSDTRLDMRVSLEKIANRLSLILRSDDQQDERLAQRDRVLTGSGDGDPGVFRAAVSWAAVRTRQAAALVDVGLRGSSPVVPFARTRWRYGMSLEEIVRLRLNQELYWRDSADRFGSISEMQFERPLTPNTVIRATSGAETNRSLRMAGDRWAWSQSVSWLGRLRYRSVIQVSAVWLGNRSEGNRLETRKASIRLRHSVWRPWVVLELEPFLIDDMLDGSGWVAGVKAGLELQLGAYD